MFGTNHSLSVTRAMLYFCREFYRSVVLKIYYVTEEMVIVVENNYSDSKLNGIVITIK